MGDFVEPAYGEASLGEVIPAAAKALGVPTSRSGLGSPGRLEFGDAPAVAVLLIDGLGSNLLERYSYAAPYLSSLLARSGTGTAGVPSTTATSLTSLGTAMTPGAHGLSGLFIRVPDTGKLLCPLFWDDEVDPDAWQPNPTAFTRLTELGVTTTVINKSAFKGSGLTRVAHRGAEFVGADRIGERIAAAMAATSGSGPSLTYLYESDLDSIGHQYGVASTEWLQQLSAVDSEAEQLREALAPGVRLVIIADHGMVDAGESDRFDIDSHQELRSGVALLAGEARFRHVHCTRGAADDVAATWASVLGDRAVVLTRDAAIERGWFGPVVPSVLPRLGDVVAAATGSVALFSSTDYDFEMTMVGLHGSLTADEMKIPILVD